MWLTGMLCASVALRAPLLSVAPLFALGSVLASYFIPISSVKLSQYDAAKLGLSSALVSVVLWRFWAKAQVAWNTWNTPKKVVKTDKSRKTHPKKGNASDSNTIKPTKACKKKQNTSNRKSLEDSEDSEDPFPESKGLPIWVFPVAIVGSIIVCILFCLLITPGKEVL
jgi:hypothetical protein